LDSIVLAETLWDAQGANDPKTVDSGVASIYYFSISL